MASAGILLLEFCLLCFIGVAWWVARRDLTARAVSSQAPMINNLREVEESIATLLNVLETRAEEIELRLEARERRLEKDKAALDTHILHQNHNDRSQNGLLSEPDLTEIDEHTVSDQIDHLMHEGLDTQSIARQSGLAVAEIETLVRMRELRQNMQVQDNPDITQELKSTE